MNNGKIALTSELPADMLQIVERIKSQPVPPDSLDRSLARAALLAAPQESTAVKGSSARANRASLCRLTLWVGAPIGLAAAVLLLIMLLLQTSPTLAHRTPDPIVGTWIGEQGQLLELRADGTARGRSGGDKTNINYYKYRLRGDQLVIYYAAKPDDFWRRLRHAIFGMSAEHVELVKLSNSELHVFDPASGRTLVFDRTEDSVLASAP
jgi:hypothetical protein